MKSKGFPFFPCFLMLNIKQRIHVYCTPLMRIFYSKKTKRSDVSVNTKVILTLKKNIQQCYPDLRKRVAMAILHI